MIILGLTGSIGMGKTTTARFFREAGIPVHDADQTVHDLYRGEAAALVESAFPGTTRNGAVDRELLRQQVVGKPEALRRLEQIIHPLVHQHENQFLRAERAKNSPLVVLDIPLLFETGADKRCDKIAVVSAPPPIQRQRVMARQQMSEDQFQTLLAKQMPDAEKRRRADFIIDSSQGLEAAKRAVDDIIAALIGRN